MPDYLNILDNSGTENCVQKFGQNDDVDTGSTPADIWTPGGLLDDSDITTPLSIVSTSASDTDGGTGMRTVRLQGVDSAGLYIQQILTLNGTTPVNVGNWTFMNVMTGVAFGSAAVNVGDINVTEAGSQLISQIAAGRGRTLQAIFCIPKDWGQQFLHNWYTTIGKQGATDGFATLLANPHRGFTADGGFQVIGTSDVNTQGSGFVLNPIEPAPEAFVGLTIVRIRVEEVTSNSTRLSGGFGLCKTPHL